MRSRNVLSFARDSDNESSLLGPMWNRLVFLKLGYAQETPGDSVKCRV